MASSASAASNGHGDGGYISDSSSSSSSSSSEPAPTPILDEQFLPRILSLFFAIFHPTEGPKIVYQVPEGSVSCGREGSKRTSEHNAKSNNTLHNPECLFEFETLSDYLIPKAALCGRLITCTTRGSGTSSNGDTPNRSQSRSRTRTPASSPTQTKHYKVLSYPVLLEDSAKYERNTFIFNLAFVFDGKADVKSYEPVVRKCARALRGLEESMSFLSSPLSQPRMYGTVEQLFQDLNSYCESFVSLPEAPHTSYIKGKRPTASANMEAAIAQARLKQGGVSVSSGSVGAAATASASLSRSLALGDGLALSRRGSMQDHLPHNHAARRGSFSPAGSLVMTSGTMMDHVTSTSAHPRSVSGSSSNASSGAALSRRPTISRAKTTSTAAVNETKVAAGSASSPAPPPMQRVFSSSSTVSTSSTSSSSSSLGMTRAPLVARDESIQAIAADLSSSLRSLRTVENNHDGSATGDDALLALIPPPPPHPPGHGEAPHGLGRTVREAINLKLFPTYANPPPVRDWDVPVSLLDLAKTTGANADPTANWDLTMSSIYPFVDGINHVKRISQLADADLELTRQCMEHLLYYGCVLMVDIFQFQNIYTLKPAIARLADDASLQAECGPYVTRPGYEIPSWPTLLDLYTALRPGSTLDGWMEERNVEATGIDARRFVTFGIIKGFLRRVHRYPVLLHGDDGDGSGGDEDDEDGDDEDEEEREMQRRASRVVRDAQIGGEVQRGTTLTVLDSANIAFAAQRRRSSAANIHKRDSPNDLPSLLDGSRCEDELCVRYGITWCQLRRMLIKLGTQEPRRGGGSGGQGARQSRSRSSNATKRRSRTAQEEWPAETAPFGNPSGFVDANSGISSGHNLSGFLPRARHDEQQHDEYDEEEEEEEAKRADELERKGAFGRVALLLL